PRELYEVNYTAEGAPQLAHETIALISRKVSIDNSWGLDHGTWSILHVMYPDKDIPVYQLSIDQTATPLEHFEMGQQIRSLRDQGVLILGSGNVVHNLRAVSFAEAGGYDWAQKFDGYIQEQVATRQYENVLEYQKQGQSAGLSVPTTDHFDPLLYILGASDKEDRLKIFNDSCMAGSLSMTSYLFSKI
ncbi:MAG: dioxygenase, partial [Vallitaleaceae bacterium]|nr:dioxygenase [Vallitaleaceae bacterium]